MKKQEKDSGKSYSLWQWFLILISGQPHFTIGPSSNPYLLRWYLLPRNKRFNLFLHKFLRDDDDRVLHDHPWWFISFLFKGGYREILESDSLIRDSPSICFRPAQHKHRVVLRVVPTWSLILTGPKIRTWGFWCPKGFVPWHRFVDSADSGNVGIGCGDEDPPEVPQVS